MLAALAADDQALVTAIVLTRLLVPLLIPRYPLAIIAALLLDAVDGSLLDQFTSVDVGPDGPYQSFDKALDIYYLAVAYLSTLRNWRSEPALKIARFLFYYRLVGVLAFELTGERAMLLLFPNTFEFYFIAYELVRTRFDPAQRSARFWFLTAAGLWIFVKIPQEYWIHIAQLDFTDTVADYAWFGPLCLLFLVALAAVLWFVVRPRLPAPDWRWRFAADPPPAAPAGARTWDWDDVGEKAALLALMSIIFAEILPTVTMTAVEVALGVVVIVAANSAIGVWLTRVTSFVARLAINLGFVYVASRVISDAEDFPLGTGLFFAFLITLMVTLYDDYKPLHDARVASR